MLVILTSFICLTSYAQLKLKYSFLDGCTNAVKHYKYSLIEFDHNQVFKSDDSGFLQIDSPGVYLISLGFERNGKHVGFSVFRKITGSGVDTIFLPKLLEETRGLHSSIACFNVCGARISGEYTDYYPNGNRRLSGKFKNGCPVGLIKNYNLDGKVVFEWFYKDCEPYGKPFYNIDEWETRPNSY